MHFKLLILITLSVLSSFSYADLVPYSIQSIEPISNTGFIKLIGPGKLEVSKKIINYNNEETIYILASNIVSLADVIGAKNSCSIRYSSHKYSESISIHKQSCMEVIKVINKSK